MNPDLCGKHICQFLNKIGSGFMKTFSLFKALTKICLKFNIGCISPNGTQECLECILTFLGDPRPPE